MSDLWHYFTEAELRTSWEALAQVHSSRIKKAVALTLRKKGFYVQARGPTNILLQFSKSMFLQYCWIMKPGRRSRKIYKYKQRYRSYFGHILSFLIDESIPLDLTRKNQIDEILETMR